MPRNLKNEFSKCLNASIGVDLGSEKNALI